MNESPTVIEIPALLGDTAGKRIVFSKDGLTIEKSFSLSLPVLIPAENICAFRYGVNSIRGMYFNIGRQYVIEIQDFSQKTHIIKLNSYYGIRRHIYYELWADLFNQLWNTYFLNTFNFYNELYQIKQEFELAGVKFKPFGISWSDGSLLYSEIALSNYQSYFMIHHKNDLKKIKRCSFKNDWNAFILQCLLKCIVEEHNMYRKLI